ncbi:hypothetical protein [Oligoflexus tunisiensis]|uniref:hypothetical protein n=1 Tax=Oligoflexus tunisiensis TaxID=708132 RepID=UPI00114D297C|nr:hypothetical protein [Oligoflexus tunisiensis]
MYTVLRMTCDSDEKLGDLINIGERIERLRKGAFTGLRKDANWFACTIAGDSDPENHRAEILSGVSLLANEIKDAIGLGFRATLDLAVEPEDFGNAPYTSIGFDSGVLEKVTTMGIGIEVTIYRP